MVLLGAILSLTRPKWLGARDTAHSVVAGLLVHGLGLRDVFVSIENGLSAGMVALVFSLHPALTSTIANRWLGEHVRLLQWLASRLGYSAFISSCATGRPPAPPRRSHGCSIG